MGEDEIISPTQVQKILNRISVDMSGGKNKQGTSSVGGYDEYRQPIIDKKLDVVIGAAAFYADGDWGHAKGVPYKGARLEFSF